MRELKYRFLTYGILTILALTLVGRGQSTSPNNLIVRSIFISEKFPDDYVRFNSGEFERKLKSLLRMGGIATPESADDADAELLIDPSIVVALDGSSDDGDLITYECKLISRTGKKIWSLKQTFIKKKISSDNETFAARRVAEKLLLAWKRGKLRVR